MKVIDLTLTFDDNIRGFSMKQATTKSENGWNAKWLNIYSHAGTHMDAPFHFEVSAETIDVMHPSRFITNAWVVDCGAVQPSQQLTVADLGEAFAKFQKGESLILKTGWSKRLHEGVYRDGLPRISEELAKWCGENEVNILAVEPPSVADVNNLEEVTHIHELLLNQNVIIVEGLCNLDQLTQEKVTLIALPLKIKKGDGAPARVIAIEGKWLD